MRVVPVVMGITYLLRVLQVSLSSPAAGVAMAVMVGLSSLGSEGAEPLSKKTYPCSFMQVSSQYVHGVVLWFTPFLFLLLLF
jgi:uncharacterized membrane protein